MVQQCIMVCREMRGWGASSLVFGGHPPLSPSPQGEGTRPRCWQHLVVTKPSPTTTASVDLMGLPHSPTFTQYK